MPTTQVEGWSLPAASFLTSCWSIRRGEEETRREIRRESEKHEHQVPQDRKVTNTCRETFYEEIHLRRSTEEYG